jgi:hypothetical protein
MCAHQEIEIMSKALTINSPMIAAYIAEQAAKRAQEYIDCVDYPAVDDFEESFDGMWDDTLIHIAANIALSDSDDVDAGDIAREILTQGQKLVLVKEREIRGDVVFDITEKMEEEIASMADIGDTAEDIAERISANAYAMRIKAPYADGHGHHPASWVNEAWDEVSPGAIVALVEARVATSAPVNDITWAMVQAARGK